MSSDHLNPAPGVRAEAELEKLRLEIQKLKSEIAGTGRRRTVDSLVRLTPLLTVLVAVFGLAFTVYQYRAEQEEARRRQTEQFDKESAEREERSRREAETAQREFMKPLLERQHDLYFQASSAAATIASSKDQAERRKAIDTFWKLYWGPLVFVESKDVSDAMNRFGDCLSGVVDCDDAKLKDHSLKLATTMEESILKTWKLNPMEFALDQFKYH